MDPVSFEKAILNKIPENSVSYCTSLFAGDPFHFKLSRDRKSKAGDYRFDKRTNKSTVTVNTGLNPYSFLITLIHEIAHHRNRNNGNRYSKPHGPEWKQEFRDLMMPVMNHLVFPEDILTLLQRHLKNPKASTSSDHRLTIALRKYNESNGDNELHLGEIEDGTLFDFNGRKFKRLHKRRTRVLCEDLKTKRKYLIPIQAVVSIVSDI